MQFRKRRPPRGARPGTLMLAPDATAPEINVFLFDAAGSEERRIADPEELRALRTGDRSAWIDVQGLGSESVLRKLAEIFDIHPLALEDIVHAPQRPKAETYPQHELWITRMVKVADETSIAAEQVSIVLGPNFVLTFQERVGDVFDPVRRRLREADSRLRRLGVDYLAYALIDTIIDDYFPAIEALGDFIEELEDDVLGATTPEILEELSDTKRTLAFLRRSLWPQRDALTRVLRDRSPFISDEVRTYLRDTLDHCVQLTEVNDSQRELVNSLQNVYLSVVSNRTNEVMQVLTIISTIFIPLTFIAGIYGMNFEHMPELRAHYAYPIVISAMIAIAIGLLIFFRRRGWLGGKGA